MAGNFEKMFHKTWSSLMSLNHLFASVPANVILNLLVAREVHRCRHVFSQRDILLYVCREKLVRQEECICLNGLSHRYSLLKNQRESLLCVEKI